MGGWRREKGREGGWKGGGGKVERGWRREGEWDRRMSRGGKEREEGGWRKEEGKKGEGERRRIGGERWRVGIRSGRRKRGRGMGEI